MNEVVFARYGWIPRVVRADGALRLELGAGADALHQPRTFSFPIAEAHLEAIRDDLTRHVLLDPILLGAPDEVESFVRGIPGYEAMLVGYGADIPMLERGQIFASMHSATEETNPERVKRYVADRGRARRGVHLTPLDAAVLQYTGHYLHGAKIPTREPEAVDPELLPGVMQIIATAEQACTGMGFALERRAGKSAAPDKREWKQIEKTVHRAVHRAYPRLADDAVRSVTFLMCSEAVRRSQDG